MKNDTNETNVGRARARSAERLLNRKRMGLESAIEALEIVGYRVSQDEDGDFRVVQPHDGWSCTSGADEPLEGVLEGFPPLLKTEDVAEIIGVSHRTVSRLCANGEIPSVKIGRSVRIPKQALIESLESRRIAAE